MRAGVFGADRAVEGVSVTEAGDAFGLRAGGFEADGAADGASVAEEAGLCLKATFVHGPTNCLFRQPLNLPALQGLQKQAFSLT